MYINPKQINPPPRKNTQKLNHVCSHYWNFPNTSTNSVNFQENPHPPQDYSENIFNKIRINNKHLNKQIIYHLMMMIIINQTFFAPYTQECRTQRPRQSQPSQNLKIYPQNPADMQNQQPMHIQNPINAQSFQPIQSQNPMTTHSYQPTQMQNEIPLPYYLQQHEITKNQLTNFSQMPNAAESLQMTMNPYLMCGSSITSNKPLIVFTGTDPEYSVEDYLNAITANLIFNIGPEPINTPLPQYWIHRRTALIETTLDGAAHKWFSVLPIDI